MKSKANAVTWGVFDGRTKRYVRHVMGGRNKRIFKTNEGATAAALLLNKQEGTRKRFFVVAHGRLQEKRAPWGGRTGRVVAGIGKKAQTNRVIGEERMDAIADLLGSCQTQVNRMEDKLAPFDFETMANTMKAIMVRLREHDLAIGRLVNSPAHKPKMKRVWVNTYWSPEENQFKSTYYETWSEARNMAEQNTSYGWKHIAVAMEVEVPA